MGSWRGHEADDRLLIQLYEGAMPSEEDLGTFSLHFTENRVFKAGDRAVVRLAHWPALTREPKTVRFMGYEKLNVDELEVDLFGVGRELGRRILGVEQQSVYVTYWREDNGQRVIYAWCDLDTFEKGL